MGATFELKPGWLDFDILVKIQVRWSTRHVYCQNWHRITHWALCFARYYSFCDYIDITLFLFITLFYHSFWQSITLFKKSDLSLFYICNYRAGSDPYQSERQMESFHWVNRDGMTSKVIILLHFLFHVIKLAERYHDSNFRFVELSKNTKRPHFLWVSRPKPVPKPEIRENDEMMVNSDRWSRKTSDFHPISCIRGTRYNPKSTWFQYQLHTPTGAWDILKKKDSYTTRDSNIGMFITCNNSIISERLSRKTSDFH